MSSSIFGPITGRPQVWGRIHPADPEWLARGPVEEALDPDLPIVDAHHHFLDVPSNRYLIEEFTSDLSGGHRVISTVYAECMSNYRPDGPEHMRPIGETEYVVELTAVSADAIRKTRIAAGIVGFADLRMGSDVREVLEGHLAAGDGRFKGIRFATAWDAADDVPNSHTADRPNMLADPGVRRGVEVLQDMNLTLDVMVFFHQLAEVAALADTYPALPIVLGHCGGPLGHGPYATHRDEHFALWERGIREVSRRPNVVCKVGGVMARGAAFDYLHAAAPASSEHLAKLWRPWFLHCIEAFGPDRCMFESNFPVDKMGVGYTVLWNTFKRIAEGASTDQRHAMFAGTADRTYGL